MSYTLFVYLKSIAGYLVLCIIIALFSTYPIVTGLNEYTFSMILQTEMTTTWLYVLFLRWFTFHCTSNLRGKGVYFGK